MQLTRELDWVAKHRLLEGYRERHGLDWSDPKLRLIDLQYHVDRAKSTIALAAAGQVERLVSEDEVERAIMEPPRTRGLLPRPMHRRVPRRDRRRVVGLDDLRHRRGCAPARPDARAAEGDEVHVDDLLERAEDAAALVCCTPTRVGWVGRSAAPRRAEGAIVPQGQERRAQKRSGGEGGGDAGQVETASKGEKLKEEMDDILDEIDSRPGGERRGIREVLRPEGRGNDGRPAAAPRGAGRSDQPQLLRPHPHPPRSCPRSSRTPSRRCTARPWSG